MSHVKFLMMEYKELVVGLLQQIVDDFIWCTGPVSKTKDFCPNEAYTEYYFIEGKRRKKIPYPQIIKSKVKMLREIQNFFESNYGYWCCSLVGWDADNFYNQLVKIYKIPPLIQRGLKENIDKEDNI